MAVLSKFAQKLVKDGYVARFNSLKNVPVFYKEELDGQLENYLSTMNQRLIDSSDLKELIVQLERNKVLVPNEKYDDLILNAIISGISKPYPAIIYLIMTEKCNFACDYCFIERYMDQKKTNVMTKEIAKKAIDFWVNQINLVPERFEEEKSVFFYGGEPLLNFEVVKYASELINEYKQKGILPEKTTLNMVTNGTCITDEMAKELNRLGIGFSISLDGATCKANICRKYHDGRLGYSDIIRGLEIAKKNNCDVGFSMTLSQEALEESDTIFELIEKYDIHSMGFNILLTDKTYSVPEEYFIKASEFIVEAFKKFRTMGVYEDRAMRKVKAFVEHRPHFQDCAAEGGQSVSCSAKWRNRHLPWILIHT